MLRLLWVAVRFEAALWRSLWLFVTGRRDGRRDGVTTVGYHKAGTGLFVMLVVGSAVEVPALHFIIPWRPVQLALLVLGIWGVTFSLGLWVAYVVRPYLVSADGVRLRHGTFTDLRLSWGQIAHVQPRDVRTWERNGFGTAITVEGGRLAYVVQAETNVALILTTPITVDGKEVTEVHVGADDPQALVAALVAGHRVAQLT
ncbi:hypothetical protein GCM10009524_04490 [Spirilliplanes yamanashiensis]